MIGITNYTNKERITIMKLFKESDNQWAVRCHLVDDMDLDIEVTFLGDKTIVNINIVESSCREGLIIHKQLDGEYVQLFSGGIVYWHGHIRDGHLKCTSVIGAVPDEIKFIDINQTIQLEYE